MLNREDNVVSRMFTAFAGFWSWLERYQMFVLLAGAGLFSLLIWLHIGQSGGSIIFNLVFFCGVMVAGFMAFRLKGSSMSAFVFAAALLVRLGLVFAFESPVPYMCNDDRVDTYRWVRHYDTALLQADEFLYAYHSQWYRDVEFTEFLQMPEVTKNAQRTSFLFSRMFRVFGDDFTWTRVVGAFLGAFAAAILTLIAERIFSRKAVVAIVSMLAVLAPQTALYSVRFLKESWLMFSVSLILFGFTAIIYHRKLIFSVLPILIGLMVLFWIRFEYALMFAAMIPVAICFRRQSGIAVRVASFALIILVCSVIFFASFEKVSTKAERLYDRFTLSTDEPRGRLAAMDSIYKSRGPLRILNLPLAMLNPPPKNLHHVLLPDNGLYDVVLQADIWQWWVPLPFLLMGGFVVVTKRREFIAFLSPYVIVVMVSSLLLGGLLPVVYRFRDSLSPIAFIVIGFGIESFMNEPRYWKKVTMGCAYGAFAVLAVYFYFV